MNKEEFINKLVPPDVLPEATQISTGDLLSNGWWHNTNGYGNPFLVFAEYGWGGPIMMGAIVVRLSKKSLRCTLEVVSIGNGQVMGRLCRKITWQEIKEHRHKKDSWLKFLGEDKEGVFIPSLIEYENELGQKKQPKIHFVLGTSNEAGELRKKIMGKKARNLDDLLRQKAELREIYEKKMARLDQEIETAKNILALGTAVHEVKEKTRGLFHGLWTFT